MNSRRDFLRNAFFGLAVLAVPGAALAGVVHPGFLLHPLGPDAELGLGWRLAKVFPPFEGAITLNLVNEDGRQARVDLCLRDGAPKGPASTEQIDFIVMDGADGTSPMDESLGRVLRRLAATVRENEGADDGRIAKLSSHAVRAWAHPESLAAAATRLSPGAPQA